MSSQQTVRTRPINLAEKFRLFAEQWSPRVVAELNDYQIKIVRIEGDFVWHDHAETDEAFFVIEAIFFRHSRVRGNPEPLGKVLRFGPGPPLSRG